MDSKASRPIAPLPKRVQQLAPDSMTASSTPGRRREIAEKVQELNNSWDLGIPTGGADSSPRKGGDLDEAGKALGWVSFFIFKHQPDELDAAVANFTARARLSNTEWKFKPGADLDTTPQRQPSGLPSYNAREISADRRQLLLKCLNACFLQQKEDLLARENAAFKNGAALKPALTSELASPALSQHPAAMVKRKAIEPTMTPGRIDTFFRKQARSPVKPGQDVAMEDAEEKVLRQFMMVPDEIFSTPPQSDAELEDDRAHTLFKSKQDTVGVKRPLSQQDPEQSASRKLRRGSSVQDQVSYPVNTYEASRQPAPRPPAPEFPGVPQAGSKAVGSLDPTAISFSDTTTLVGTSFRSDTTAGTAASNGAGLPPAALGPKHLFPANPVDGNGDRMDVDEPGELKPGPEVPLKIGTLLNEDYFKQRLFLAGPFPEAKVYERPPRLRVAYEATRVALHTGHPPQQLITLLTNRGIQRSEDYGGIWSVLAGHVCKEGVTMPERTSPTAWKQAETFSTWISMSGNLQFASSPEEPLFKLSLRPLQIEKSYRLKRHFGSQRFLQIGFPGLSTQSLPPFLKKHSELARERITEWLLSQAHHFLGRVWRIFFNKAQSGKKSKFEFNDPRSTFYLFAEDGFGFTGSSLGSNGVLTGPSLSSVPFPSAMTVEKMLSWFIDVPKHRDHSALKLFSRLALGVSQTTPTFAFKMPQIFRTDDAFSSDQRERTLNVTRSEEKKKGLAKKLSNRGAVMNDGCARISRRAARHVADALGLPGDETPSAFQGRIGGAKGIWFVDCSNEGGEDAVWIEVTDSQLKFEWHTGDLWHPDEERVTFEVTRCSAPLRSARLNFQFMPLLINRGVPSVTLEEYLQADITARASKAEAAKASARSLACWNQSVSSLASRRKADGSMEWLGGTPRDRVDQINYMVESGFLPSQCTYLYTMVFEVVKGYVKQLEDRMNIGISCSCYAYCMADPLGVLEEGEVHFGFSSRFSGEERIPGSTEEKQLKPWAGGFIHGRDVLVARSPSHLPSDIQRVRAVFKPELSTYEDVIIFSSKGAQAQADKLSGGDYDGDEVWVCWDRGLVEPFENKPVPSSKEPNHYGMKKDTTTVGELGANATTKMLRKGLEASMRTPMLGIATNYLESYNYYRWTRMGKTTPETPESIEIGQLLGHLVDAPKAGLSFSESDFHDYVKHKRLKVRYAPPAYKTGDTPKQLCHPIDKARAVGRQVRQEVLANLTTVLKDASKWDESVGKVAAEEKAMCKGIEPLEKVLEQLNTQLEQLKDWWARNRRQSGDNNGAETHEQPREGMSFGALVEQARDTFVNIGPLAVDHPTAKRWQHEHTTAPLALTSSWLRLKTSQLFRQFNTYNFIWWVAMREICSIKALAQEGASPVVREIKDVMRLDTRLVRRLDRSEEERLALIAEEEQDEFDEGGAADAAFAAVFNERLQM